MRREDFNYQLPPALIAQHPPSNRLASRLLCLEGDSGAVKDLKFVDLASLLSPGDVLVFNDTRVLPARLLGNKATGGKVEVLVERILSDTLVLAHIRSNKKLKLHTKIVIANQVDAEIVDRHGNLFELAFHHGKSVLEILALYGQIPLPPYITRVPEEVDAERYQTVYAKSAGAVAAPTAGLHFDKSFIRRLEQHGVLTRYITLHVASGTFQPVRVDKIADHKMHSEFVQVSEQVCETVNTARANGNRVVAVGTTSLRSLESAWFNGQLHPFNGYTDIFIYPGVTVNAVDALITNFHLPESTLLMLVSAFAGYDNVMYAYQHAIEQGYRFFSYGDAMFITKKHS